MTFGPVNVLELTLELSGTISGSGAPNSIISFYFDGVTSDIHNVTANATGAYNFTVLTATVEAPLLSVTCPYTVFIFSCILWVIL